MLTSTVSPSLKFGLSLIGMWPGSSRRMFFWLFYMVTLVTMQYFQYSYFFAHLGINEFSKLMDGLSITLDYTLTFLKLLSLWHNRRIFSDILGAMNNDWNDCPTHTCVMSRKANLAHRCSNVMITLNSLSVIFYFIGNYVSHRTVSTDFRKFPIQVQFPFNATYSPIFEFIVLGLFLHVWETAIIIALLNSLILTLVLHVSGQIDIMCQGLRNISTTQKSHPSVMKSLIERHQKIISLSNNIDSFFSFIALIQFIWNTIVICSIGLMIVISLGMDVENKSGLLIQSIVPYIAVTLEAFVFCFAGEYLSTKVSMILLLLMGSKSISDAAYETLWYDLSTSECRILLLIIVRSQKRLTITAGKVMDLTLEGFTSIMKASASYVSVLLAMY